MTIPGPIVISERINGVLTCVVPNAGGCALLVGLMPEGSLYPELKAIPARYEMELLVAIHRQTWNARKGRQ